MVEVVFQLYATYNTIYLEMGTKLLERIFHVFLLFVCFSNKGPLTYMKNFKQLLLLGRFLHPKQDLPQVGGGLVLLPDGDVDGVTNQPSSQLFYPFRDGRRHEQALPLLWDLLQHLQHLLLEAHLQHGVHLHSATTEQSVRHKWEH